jgi:hypothetical protein
MLGVLEYWSNEVRGCEICAGANRRCAGVGILI